MTSERPIRDVMADLVREIFELDPTQNIADDLDVGHLGDSLQQLELISAIEGRFGIALEVEELPGFADLVVLVTGHVSP